MKGSGKDTQHQGVNGVATNAVLIWIWIHEVSPLTDNIKKAQDRRTVLGREGNNEF